MPMRHLLCLRGKCKDFELIVYVSTRFHRSDEMGKRDDFIILSDHTDEYFLRHVENGLFVHSSTFIWAMQNTGVYSRTFMDYELSSSKLTQMEKRVLKKMN